MINLVPRWHEQAATCFLGGTLLGGTSHSADHPMILKRIMKLSNGSSLYIDGVLDYGDPYVTWVFGVIYPAGLYRTTS